MADEYEIWVPPNAIMRERATVPSVDRRSLALVKGYLVPRYIEQMADGRRVAELNQRDLDRVSDGYACGECLAYFDLRLSHCPSCSHDLDPARDIVDYHPAHWQPSEGRTSAEILSSLQVPRKSGSSAAWTVNRKRRKKNWVEANKKRSRNAKLGRTVDPKQ